MLLPLLLPPLPQVVDEVFDKVSARKMGIDKKGQVIRHRNET